MMERAWRVFDKQLDARPTRAGSRGPMSATWLSLARVGWRMTSCHSVVADRGQNCSMRPMAPMDVKELLTQGIQRWQGRMICSHIDIVKALVRRGNADVNKNDNRNNSPLAMAVTKGHRHVARFLIKNGAVDSTVTHPFGKEFNSVKEVASILVDQSMVNSLDRNSCTWCEKLCKLSKCSKCMEVGYCSVECQTQHWSTHKAECKIIRQRRRREANQQAQ